MADISAMNPSNFFKSWDAAQSAGITRFCQTIGPHSSSQKKLAGGAAEFLD